MESIMGKKVNPTTVSMVKENILYALREGMPYWEMDIRPQYSITGSRYSSTNTFQLLAAKFRLGLDSDRWLTEHGLAIRKGSLLEKAFPTKIRTQFAVMSKDSILEGLVYNTVSLYNLDQTTLGSTDKERLDEIAFTWGARSKTRKAIKSFLKKLGYRVLVSRFHKTPFMDGDTLILSSEQVKNEDQLLFQECRVAAHKAATSISERLLLSSGSLLRESDLSIARELASAELFGAAGCSFEALGGYKAREDAVKHWRRMAGEPLRLAYALSNSQMITTAVLKPVGKRKSKKKKS
jgi:hypothetical protein